MKNLKRRVSFIVIVATLVLTMTTMIKVHGATLFQGNVEDESNDPLSGVSIVLSDCYTNILGYDTTDGSGDYSFYATLNGNSPYLLSAGKTRYTYEYEIITSGGTNDFELEFIPEKIAVLFWASDAGLQSVIDDYRDILEYEDYTTIYEFQDSSNVAANCATVDAYETDQDTIFVYVIGHGSNTGSHSYTYFKEDSGSQVYSNTFRGYMDAWEAPKKAILVESCKSGDWADDFAASPYLAMSTSDETHLSWTYSEEPPDEGDFSHWFFEHVANGYTAVQSFTYASGEITHTQNPKKQDNSSYDWFD